MAQYLAPGQVENSSGVPLNGAKMYVYVPASTTPVSLYTEETLSTGTANPLVADASGMFPEAFLAETKVKIIITTSAGVTVWTRDVIYTTGVATNVPASGVSFDGTTSGLASDNVQDVIDEVVELQGLTQEWTTSSSGVVATGTSTNAGSAVGPGLDLYRNSASPANLDLLGFVAFTGKNSAGSKVTYTYLSNYISDTTNGSEDAVMTIQTVVAGSVAARLNIGAGAWMEGATGTDKGAGTFNATAFYQGNSDVRPLISGTPQVTTSGTSIDYTSIPSWVKRITVCVSGVSTNGTSLPLIQIGDSGGIENTGYGGTSWDQNTTLHAFSAGFEFASVWGASETATGFCTLVLMNSATFTWAFSAFLGGYGGSGVKSLTATLDRLRLTTTNGTDAFDAGSVNILYE